MTKSSVGNFECVLFILNNQSNNKTEVKSKQQPYSFLSTLL
jgi:hypothetical protein